MNYKDILKKLKVADANERNVNRWTNTYVALPYKKNTLPGKTVEIRLRFLPDLVEAEKTGTISPYVRYFHSFRSRSTNTQVEIGCNPGHCPICDYSISRWKSGDEEVRLALKRDSIMKKTSYYLNAYVVDNPIDPTQNGKIRILKFGSQLKKKFDTAVTGRDADRIGMRLFDLGPDGYTFVVNVLMKGEFPNYEDSYVDSLQNSQKDVRDLTEDDIDRIMHETIYIPEKFNTPDRDTALREFRVHYLCSVDSQVHSEETIEVPTDDKPIDESVPADATKNNPDTEPVAPPKQTPVNDVQTSVDTNDKPEKSKEDQELDDILSGVQIPF